MEGVITPIFMRKVTVARGMEACRDVVGKYRKMGREAFRASVEGGGRMLGEGYREAVVDRPGGFLPKEKKPVGYEDQVQRTFKKFRYDGLERYLRMLKENDELKERIKREKSAAKRKEMRQDLLSKSMEISINNTLLTYQHAKMRPKETLPEEGETEVRLRVIDGTGT